MSYIILVFTPGPHAVSMHVKLAFGRTYNIRVHAVYNHTRVYCQKFHLSFFILQCVRPILYSDKELTGCPGSHEKKA